MITSSPKTYTDDSSDKSIKLNDTTESNGSNSKKAATSKQSRITLELLEQHRLSHKNLKKLREENSMKKSKA